MRFTGFVTLLLSIAGLAFAAEPAKAKKQPAPKAPDPAFAPISEVAGLPRVLLIGDSISIGYHLGVRRHLAGIANVLRPPENCGDSGRGLGKLDAWLGQGKWDVIHFNFGLHDLKYLDAAGKYVPPEQGKQVASPEAYERNLRQILARLQRTGARLIFATTTPVPAGSTGRVENDELRYNEVAVRVMRELGVAIDDLHARAMSRQAQIQLPRNVHFTPDGYAFLAEAVAASIRPFLPARPAAVP